MEIQAGRYFIGVWFAGDGDKDWMASVWRDKPDDPWHLEYRFRYYAGEDPWDGKDKKSWYSGTISASHSAEDIKARIDAIAELITIGFGELQFVPMFSDDVDKNITAIQGAPFVHMKTMNLEDAKKEGYL